MSAKPINSFEMAEQSLQITLMDPLNHLHASLRGSRTPG